MPEEFLGRGWMWDDKDPLIEALTVKGHITKEKQNYYFNAMPLLWGRFFLLISLLETKKKRWVVFCLMENNYIVEENDPKIFENRIIEYIYQNL